MISFSRKTDLSKMGISPGNFPDWSIVSLDLVSDDPSGSIHHLALRVSRRRARLRRGHDSVVIRHWRRGHSSLRGCLFLETPLHYFRGCLLLETPLHYFRQLRRRYTTVELEEEVTTKRPNQAKSNALSLVSRK